MLGFRILVARSVTEQKPLVQLLVDEVLVDRLRTLGTANRVDDHLIAQALEAHEIGDNSLDDTKLFLGPDSATEINDSRLYRDLNVVGIKGELLVEGVAHQRAQLVVAEFVGRPDVLVIAFHVSSAASPAAREVQVTGRTTAKRRSSVLDCPSRKSGPGSMKPPPSRPWVPGSMPLDTSVDRDSRSSLPSAEIFRR